MHDLHTIDFRFCYSASPGSFSDDNIILPSAGKAVYPFVRNVHWFYATILFFCHIPFRQYFMFLPLLILMNILPFYIILNTFLKST